MIYIYDKIRQEPGSTLHLVRLQEGKRGCHISDRPFHRGTEGRAEAGAQRGDRGGVARRHQHPAVRG